MRRKPHLQAFSVDFEQPEQAFSDDLHELFVISEPASTPLQHLDFFVAFSFFLNPNILTSYIQGVRPCWIYVEPKKCFYTFKAKTFDLNQ